MLNPLKTAPINGYFFTYRDRVLPSADRREERQPAHRLQGLRASGQQDVLRTYSERICDNCAPLCRG